jgi:hypothetical protein
MKRRWLWALAPAVVMTLAGAAPALADASGSNLPTTPNQEACFGQVRSEYRFGGPSVGGAPLGSILSTRKGSNSTQNADFRAFCDPQ